MSISRLEDEVGDGDALLRWMAYFDIEPPGQDAWHRTAMLALNARRIAGDKKTKLRDFLPHQPKKVESPEVIDAKLRAIFGAPQRKQPATSLQPDDDEE